MNRKLADQNTQLEEQNRLLSRQVNLRSHASKAFISVVKAVEQKILEDIRKRHIPTTRYRR